MKTKWIFIEKSALFFVEAYHTNDGILIPIGRPINANIAHSSLLYNEYIVYNTEQIKIKYLLRLDFKFKNWLICILTDVSFFLFSKTLIVVVSSLFCPCQLSAVGKDI